MNPQTASSRSSRKRHGSDDYESESSTESNGSVDVPIRRKKKFRKGGKKRRLSESEGAASSVLSEMTPEPDNDIIDFEPKLLMTENKSKRVRIHRSSDFFKKNTKEYKDKRKLFDKNIKTPKGKQKKRKIVKHNPNRDTKYPSTDDDDDNNDNDDRENIIVFKGMKNVFVRSGDGNGQFDKVKVHVEDEHFWSRYKCDAYEKNGGMVIRFNDRRSESEYYC